MAISIKIDSGRELQYKSQALGFRTGTYLTFLRNGKVTSVTGVESMKGKMVGDRAKSGKGWRDLVRESLAVHWKEIEFFCKYDGEL